MPKVEKTKKSKEKNIHPKSRKAGQLSKVINHEEKKQRRKNEHASKQETLKEKILWFKDQLEDGQGKYSLSEVSEIITRYINRFEERVVEIEQQNEFNRAKGRHGRYHAAEEEAIKMVREKEQDLFIHGKFEAPDITSTANVKIIREWDGDIKKLQNIKLKQFKEISCIGSKNNMET